MNILATADLHGNFSGVNTVGVDVLLIAGDVVRYDEAAGQTDDDLRLAAEGVLKIRDDNPNLEIVMVLGNHDSEMHKRQGADTKRTVYDFGLRGEERIHCLDQDEFVWSSSVSNLKVVGIPWFAARGGDRKRIEKKYSTFGKEHRHEMAGADIVLVHCPPVVDGLDSPDCSEAVAQTIKHLKPRCVITGHLHKRAGRCELEGIPVYNVAESAERMSF